MVDGAALGVGGGDAVVDEAFVQGKVWARAVLGQPVGAGWPRCDAVICPAHRSRWSIGSLPVELSTARFVLAAGVAGRLGYSRYRISSGEAEFGGPALDMRPEPVVLPDTFVGRDVR